MDPNNDRFGNNPNDDDGEDNNNVSRLQNYAASFGGQPMMTMSSNNDGAHVMNEEHLNAHPGVAYGRVSFPSAPSAWHTNNNNGIPPPAGALAAVAASNSIVPSSGGSVSSVPNASSLVGGMPMTMPSSNSGASHMNVHFNINTHPGVTFGSSVPYAYAPSTWHTNIIGGVPPAMLAVAASNNNAVQARGVTTFDDSVPSNAATWNINAEPPTASLAASAAASNNAIVGFTSAHAASMNNDNNDSSRIKSVTFSDNDGGGGSGPAASWREGVASGSRNNDNASSLGGVGSFAAGRDGVTRNNDTSYFCPSDPKYHNAAGIMQATTSVQSRGDDHTLTSGVHHHPDLPFLITHWLSQYAPPTSSFEERPKALDGTMTTTTDNGQEEKRQKALKIIHQESSKLAWAFQTLGAFGQSSSVSNLSKRPTTYSDLSRKYSSLLSVPALPLSSTHNENRGGNSNGHTSMLLLDALVSTSSTAHISATKHYLESVMPWSLLEAAYEKSVPIKGGRSPSTMGGNVLSAYATDTMDHLFPCGAGFGSAMLKPNNVSGAALLRDMKTIHHGAAQASRKQLSLRIELVDQRKDLEDAMQTLQISQQSLANNRMQTFQQQQQSQTLLYQQQQTHTQSSTIQHQPTQPQPTERTVHIDSNMGNHNHARITAQFERRMNELNLARSGTNAKLAEAKQEAMKSYRDMTSGKRSQDLHQVNNGEGRTLLHRILKGRTGHQSNNLGYGARSHGILARQYQSRSSSMSQLSILKSRLSHAVTISSHLIYPIYCLKFDKTGRYFITGSDDQVAKVFVLGVGQRSTSSPSVNHGANVRGAVLVCSLRGHAGVVSDIDVSADNALLATASGDGDVRVWGLKDGRPLAILRGHKDGANMVSWSTLTPYRLVTCGEDGLARMWDVRKAVQKRYYNGEKYYSWPEKKQVLDTATALKEDNDVDMEQDTQALLSSNPVQQPVQLPAFQEPPPPQPPGVDDHQIAVANNNPAGINNNIPAPIHFGNPLYGEFIANSNIDAGVSLIAQLQHGTLLEESATRQGRKKVKVMCLARCPAGKHFATGSDDGIVRVWGDEDDWRMERFDFGVTEFEADKDDGMAMARIASSKSSMFGQSKAPSTERLLATLREHQNAVTDMMYSSAGDRILSASMKDGNLCIWSWGTKFSNISQVCIQLTPVSQGGPSTADVHCDGVAWTCDDMKVITSQSSPTKTTGSNSGGNIINSTNIIQESHMIYVWDSHSGNCLMGLMSSHSSLCSTLSPHPTLSSVFASAGSDGVVNVWDLDRGDLFFTHTNKLLHGPMDQVAMTNRGKPCGYLEVQFSPDGFNLVVADESGRVTILDTLVPQAGHAQTDDAVDNVVVIDKRYQTPAWMKEQYFANDYYDLVYDTNGYCIEKGSQQPPHLAPDGVRCTHEGVANHELVEDTYRGLSGPLPLSPNDSRWIRNDMRGKSVQSSLKRSKKHIAKSPDLSWKCDSTAIITKSGRLFQYKRKHLSLTASKRRASGTNRKSNNISTLSDRYDWRDAYDEINSDSEEDNDEDYLGGNYGRRLQESSEEELEEEEDDGNDDNSHDESTARSSRSRMRQHQSGGGRSVGRGTRRSRGRRRSSSHEELQPSRVSSRQTAQRTNYHDLHSDDEALEEMMSTHTKPSGNFVQDWDVAQHYFKMPRDDVRRKWLSRTTYQGKTLGRKFICPQVGDSVVYVPRAHDETLKKYPIPGYSPPWANWPTHSTWPVVCCTVQHVRYRFPYEMYYRSRSKEDKLQGVMAILTLEITGVPSPQSSSPGRTFPWPEAKFVPPTSSRTRSIDSTTFEITLFECNEDDFLIPTHLYEWRVNELEKAIMANNGNAHGVSVTVYCPPDDDTTEDVDRVGYTGTLTQVMETSEGELHFMESGYHALNLKWDVSEDNIEDKDTYAVYSVWDVSVNNPSCDTYIVPAMGDVVKNAVKKALHTITEFDTGVKEWFYDHVDTNRYTDYLEMIEIPMYLSLIQQRLRGDYYTNKLSAVSDMELVKESCYKYNEDNNEFYDLACRMYDKFKVLVDSIEDDESAGIEERAQICSGRTSVSPAKNNRKQRAGGEGIDTSEESPDAGAQTGEGEELDTGAKAESSNGLNGKVQDEEMGDVEESEVVSHRPTQRATIPVVVSHRQTRQRSTQEPQPPEGGRRASVRAISRKPSYEEKDPEEEEEESSEGSGGEEEENQPTEAGRRTSPRARRKPTHADEENQPTEAGRRTSPRARRKREENQPTEEAGRRTSSRARSKPAYADKDTEEDEETSENSDVDEIEESADEVSEVEEETTKKSTRISFRARKKPSYLDKGSDEDEASEEEETPPKRVKARITLRAKRKPSHEDQEPADDGDSEEEETSPKRVGARTSSRARSKPSSYLDNDSDEEDEYSENSGNDDVNEENDDEVSIGEEEEEGYTTRKRKCANDERIQRNKRARAASAGQKKGSRNNFPDLETWPAISERRIKKVGLAVLKKLREMDTLGLFSVPVLEAWPDMEDDYLQEVENPMDFRTIEEERLPDYRYIAELQEDLILTFHNCCVFNKKEPEYYDYAREMWQGLNDVYREVVEDKYV